MRRILIKPIELHQALFLMKVVSEISEKNKDLTKIWMLMQKMSSNEVVRRFDQVLAE